MAAIKKTNYQNIANYYTNAQRQIVGVSSYYYQGAYEIVSLDTFDPTIDLVVAMNNAYLSSQTIYLQTPQAIIEAVRILQNHVLSRARTDPSVDTVNGPARFSDINDWIDAAGTNSVGTNVGRQDDDDASFKVSSEFASLSAQAGYSIEAGNIL